MINIRLMRTTIVLKQGQQWPMIYPMQREINGVKLGAASYEVFDNALIVTASERYYADAMQSVKNLMLKMGIGTP